jgi:hypothetical protein
VIWMTQDTIIQELEDKYSQGEQHVESITKGVVIFGVGSSS